MKIIVKFTSDYVSQQVILELKKIISPEQSKGLYMSRLQ